jgi:hypothetical protein
VADLPLELRDDDHVKGARLMFEEFLRGGVLTQEDDVGYALYMEPDTVPIQPYWLSQVRQQVSWPVPEFWILGSIYRGDLRHIVPLEYDPAEHYAPNFFHINGNAVYNLRSKSFRSFYFDDLRPYVAKKHNGDSFNAYDTDVNEYLTDVANSHKARTWMHYFRYTDLIQNQWYTDWSATDLIASSPNTVLVHGGTPIGTANTTTADRSGRG